MNHTIAAVDRSRINVAALDFAAVYYGEREGEHGRYFLDVDAVTRFLMHIHLSDLRTRYGAAPVRNAVNTYLAQHPEVLTRTAAERVTHAKMRANLAQRLRKAAAKAYRAADYDRASRLIDTAELITPRYDWQRFRDTIAAARRRSLTTTAAA